MNYLYQVLASVGIGAISFLLGLFIARQLGASQFGQYSIALSVGSILGIIFDGGMRALLTRERTKASKHLDAFHKELPHIAMGYSLVTALLASIICIAIFPSLVKLGLGIILCFWGVIITQFASAILRGDGHLKDDALWQIQQRLLTATIIISCILIGLSEAWQILFAWAIGAILSNLLLNKGFRFKPLFRAIFTSQFKYYRNVLPFLWIDFSTAIYFRSDLILLGHFKISDSEIGQYAAAFRLVEAALLVASPISIVIFREIRLLHEKQSLQKSCVIRAMLMGALFGFLGLVLFKLIATPLVKITYGPDYTITAELLTSLGWIILILIPNAILTQAALALNLEKTYALAASIAATSSISLNLLLIPHYGVLAAAYNSIVTELVLMAVLLYAVIQKIKNVAI